MPEITLKTLVIRFKWQILLTNLMVFLESMLGVLIPFFIGLAINDLLDQSFQGVIYLIVVSGEDGRFIAHWGYMVHWLMHTILPSFAEHGDGGVGGNSPVPFMPGVPLWSGVRIKYRLKMKRSIA